MPSDDSETDSDSNKTSLAGVDDMVNISDGKESNVENGVISSFILMRDQDSSDRDEDLTMEDEDLVDDSANASQVWDVRS